jgi:hypothetical protein
VASESIAEHRAVNAVRFYRARGATVTGSAKRRFRRTAFTVQLPVACTIVVTHHRATSTLRDNTDEALLDFSAALRDIPEVVAITHSRDHSVNLVWTFIRRRDLNVRRRVYAYERSLMERYPSLSFDFNVVSLDQSIDGALVPDDLQGRLIMYRSTD